MTDDRPNPDELLARVKAEEAEAHRGKLKIFFGYAAGVGKTYAMLEAAHREKAQGVEVVVGYVEPHGRAETEALVQGLEALPFKQVPYRGVMLREFDLDAALARHPQLLLVDELAHTNAEGLRHTKRWQDVDELLEAGINVYTTLNVQHVESLNDVIAQITGVIVRETLPDAVLEKADEIELIDLTPEELIERLQAGKVYMPEQAVRAIQSFFHKSNLTALRELSLRQAANRLRRDVDAARKETAAVEPWATNERLLVCVGASPTTAKLLRTAKRMAAAFGCEWLAVAVETNAARVPDHVRRQVAKHLQLAGQLGAETHTLIGLNVADTVLEYARSRNVTKIVVGKTAQPWWRRIVLGTVVDDLLEHSGDIDVYVIRGEAEEIPKVTSSLPTRKQNVNWMTYLWTLLVVVVCGFLGWLGQLIEVGEANIVLIFLLGVVFVATWFGRGPAVTASIANVLVFDFCFVPPYFSFTVNDAKYLWTFAVMLGIGLVHSTFATRVREQLSASQQQERRTGALFRLTRLLSEVMGSEFLIRTAGRQISELFAGEVVVFLRLPDDQIELRFGEGTRIAAQPINAIVAQWVATHSQIAGEGTDTLPNATALFVPLVGSQQTVGAIGVKPDDPNRLLDTEQRRMLETCASLIALAIERDQSVLEAQQAQVAVETEQLRNSILSSVSHDLRTPLAAIAGAASSLLEGSTASDSSTQRELLQTMVDESHRLARLVDNLLEMTRLEAGPVTLSRQWHVLEEIVGSALARVRRELARHSVRVALPRDLPLVSLDGMLFEQVLVNLLENAARYTPPGSLIEISASYEPKQIEIRLADNGPGLPPGNESRVFEKFFRAASHTPDGRRGVGLGLTICQQIVRAHGGSITAHNRSTGGAEFRIILPCAETAPTVTLDAPLVSSEA